MLIHGDCEVWTSILVGRRDWCIGVLFSGVQTVSSGFLSASSPRPGLRLIWGIGGIGMGGRVSRRGKSPSKALGDLAVSNTMKYPLTTTFSTERKRSDGPVTLGVRDSLFLVFLVCQCVR